MSRYQEDASGALNFDDALLSLGFASAYPAQRKLVSAPILHALTEAGTSHVYADTASPEEIEKTIGADDTVVAEVDGNTINQPLLAKVIGAVLDEGDPAAWLSALRRHRTDLPERDVAPWLYTIALARAGGAVLQRFGGGRRWEVSLQLHMSATGEVERPLHWGRALRAMVPSCLVKVPFTPDAAECFLVARTLEEDGIPVNFTSTFSARQAVAAALLSNATRTNIFMGRLDQGLEADLLGAHVDLEAQRALRRLREDVGVATRLIVASLHDWRSIVRTAGCDVYTAPTDVLAGLMNQQEIDPQSLRSRLETSYESELGIAPSVLERLGRERIARLWQIEPEFIEFLCEYRASDDFRDARDGDSIRRRFEEAGFGDFFDSPSADERESLRKEKLPDLDAPITGRIALDTLYTLLANADFTKHQERIDLEIQRRIVGPSGGNDA